MISKRLQANSQNIRSLNVLTPGKRTAPLKNIAPSVDTKSASASASKFQLSHLPNGIKIASEDSPGHFAAVGVFVDAGSRHEYAPFFGLSHFNDRLAFKSTTNQTRENVMNTLEQIGGNCMSMNSRENIMYQASVFKHDIPPTLALMADTIRNPVISAEEIDEARATIEYELQETYSKPEQRIPELAHRAAFQNNTYGHSQICTPETLANCTLENIRRYRDVFYRPSSLVVAAVGVPHQALCDWTEQYFGSMSEPYTPRRPEPSPVKYTGGEVFYEESDKDGLSRFFLGFESAAFNHADVYAISTLQIMLGGGDSFSAGGPGKGMYSRLYTNVLNRYAWAESITATNMTYRDTGLFGFQGTVPHNCVANMISVIGQEIRKVLDKPISSVELDRAKNQLRSSLFMNLESKMVHLEDLGRQVQMYSKRISPSEIGERIEQVTAADITRVMRKMTAKKPTFMLVGSSKYAPEMQRFQQVYKLGPKYASIDQ